MSFDALTIGGIAAAAACGVFLIGISVWPRRSRDTRPSDER